MFILYLITVLYRKGGIGSFGVKPQKILVLKQTLQYEEDNLMIVYCAMFFRYSYYRSSIADKISDYEDIWEKSERCLSPAESELQFKAYLANKLTQNNFEDDLPSSYCR